MGITTDMVDIKKIAKGREKFPRDVIDFDQFFEQVVKGYNEGWGPDELPADQYVARSLIPAGTAYYRDFSYIAPEIPEYIPENCVGCMTCVTECPDTAILGKVVEPKVLEEYLARQPEEDREYLRHQFTETTKYYTSRERKEPGSGGLFGIFIDPTKCKGCAECVEVCHELGYDALKMIKKQDETVPQYRKSIQFFRSLPPTPKKFINDRVLIDMMLSEEALLYTGGAGSCAGCGEGTALRMLMSALGFAYGRENIGLLAATGCNTVYGSTYPYNPFLTPWSNSLFENAATFAMGVRARWDQQGWKEKQLWVIGGDGAMYDIGFQALSRMLASGKNINVFILDTQVYSNTGGQASTASFMGQEAKMAAFGKAIQGKQEARKEIARILMMHPDAFIAQTTPAHYNHFYRAVLDAASYEGPSVIVVYTTCQPEHSVGDAMSYHQAKLAVDTRTFPLLIYDPRKGDTIRERLSLKGNPAMKQDWYRDPKTGEEYNFITFARTEGRFAKHFDKEGNPSPTLLRANEDRLRNWHMLQELAGLR